MPQILTIPLLIYLLSAMQIAWFGIAGGWLIYRHREQHDRSRLYLALPFFLLALGCTIFVVTGLVRGDLTGFLSTILEPYPMMLAFVAALSFPIYVLEVQQPYWLTWKRFFIIISPWLALCAAWLIYHGMHHWQYDAITHLTDFRQVLPNISSTDVLLRVLLNVIFIPYAFAILFIPYNWRTSNVCASQLRKIKWLIVICFILYTLGVNLRIHSLFLAYLVVLNTLSVYIIVIEKTGLIPLPQCNEPEPAPQPEKIVPDLSPLAHRLQQQLASQIWQNPDLDRDDVCQLLGTNYTYLSSAIQELGFANFHEMLNRYRAIYMHDLLVEISKLSLSDAIYLAGFRSRSTAVNSFKQVYHCTPTDFVKGQR